MRWWSGIAAAAWVAALAIGCGEAAPPPRVLCLGDSITLGTTRGGERNGVDPAGGYGGRLAQRLGGRAEVRRRAAGGATAAMWLESPNAPRGRTLATVIDQVGPRLPPDAWHAPRVVDAVLDADRPDVVVVLLGTNDLLESRAEPADAAVEHTLRGLLAVRDAIVAHGARALMSTVLPSRRPTAAREAALDARLRAEVPEVLDLGAGFEAMGGVDLLGDAVHPSEAGHEVLAGLVADALEQRGIVAAR